MITKIINGDCLEVMKTFPDNHFSAIVTDPPYGLKFMGKEWDHGIPGVEFWKQALRISKPGTFLLAFGGTRTFHRLTCAIEDAGWEIRDCIMWVYGQGFPKSHNNFGIKGFGTTLKPSYEPIIMAMKPCDGTFKQNAEKWGQAGINIDECRIGCNRKVRSSLSQNKNGIGWVTNKPCVNFKYPDPNIGRWPANLILDEEAGSLIDEQSGDLKTGGGNRRPNAPKGLFKGFKPMHIEFHANSGGASRFFYCAKASSSERNEGLENLPFKKCGIKNDSGRGFSESDPYKKIEYKNNHPTVKPLKLMEYLIKLIMPPKDGILLDPFAGSGSTVLAAKNLDFQAIGIEKNPDYCEIANARIK